MAKRSAVDLFKLALEGSDAAWAEVTVEEKLACCWPWQRWLAAGFPLVAAQLNVPLAARSPAVVDFWRSQLRRHLKRVPPWFYEALQASKADGVTEQLRKFDQAVLSKYCELHELGTRDLRERVLLFPQATLGELRELQVLFTDDAETRRDTARSG